MFLRHLRLQNIRSVRELDLAFELGGDGRPWTYVLGENGTGKSSVLKSIALVMAGGDAVSELVGAPDDWIRLGEDEAWIGAEFATAEGEPRQAELRFRRGTSAFNFLSENREAVTALDAAISHSARNYFVVGYGVARRSPQDGMSGVSAFTP